MLIMPNGFPFQSRWVFSFLIAPTLLVFLNQMGDAFFFDQSSEGLLYLVLEYCLRSFVVYQTLWIYYFEWIIIIIIIIFYYCYYYRFQIINLPLGPKPSSYCIWCSPQNQERTDKEPFTGKWRCEMLPLHTEF